MNNRMVSYVNIAVAVFFSIEYEFSRYTLAGVSSYFRFRVLVPVMCCSFS
jgi:hypothetical protein